MAAAGVTLSLLGVVAAGVALSLLGVVAVRGAAAAGRDWARRGDQSVLTGGSGSERWRRRHEIGELVQGRHAITPAVLAYRHIELSHSNHSDNAMQRW